MASVVRGSRWLLVAAAGSGDTPEDEDDTAAVDNEEADAAGDAVGIEGVR